MSSLSSVECFKLAPYRFTSQLQRRNLPCYRRRHVSPRTSAVQYIRPRQRRLDDNALRHGVPWSLVVQQVPHQQPQRILLWRTSHVIRWRRRMEPVDRVQVFTADHIDENQTSRKSDDCQKHWFSGTVGIISRLPRRRPISAAYLRTFVSIQLPRPKSLIVILQA